MSELITTADVQYDTTHLSNVIDYRVKKWWMVGLGHGKVDICTDQSL